MAPTPKPELKKLIVAAPFGNYIDLGGRATPTLGTFTLDRRPGRLKQILKTVRYNPFTRSWRNKLGLRNPGIQWLVDEYSDNPSFLFRKIVSIHEFNRPCWTALINIVAKALRPDWVELNLSCPNVGAVSDIAAVLHNIDMFDDRTQVIVKLPPTMEVLKRMLDVCLDAGIRIFHCTNTLPHPKGKGGISGALLREHALTAITWTRGVGGKDVTIIGGGGIQSWRHFEEFEMNGADHFAIASPLFFPWNLIRARQWAKRLNKES